jgi:hypothetical protein
MRALIAGAGLWLALPTSATAQSVPTDAGLPRYVAGLSAGVPLRITRNVDLDQSAIAPVFTDALGGYVFRGTSYFQHGVGLGLSLNLSADGGFTEPTAGGQQFVVMPAYLLAWNPDPDFFGLGHAGLPVTVAGTNAMGLELAFALGYRWLAGAGTFAELGFDLFRGVGGTMHPSISLELGVLLEYEVLP